MNTSELDVSALLNLYVYLDIQKHDYKGKTIQYILSMDSFTKSITHDTQKEYYEILKAAVDPNSPQYNHTFASMELESQSGMDANIPKKELIACAFTTNSGEHYIAYRGTGDGKWVDNGEGMYKVSTIMQERAAQFFDYYAKLANLDESNRVIVTGHSKGGNCAQYVTLMSKYANLVDTCYSLDGQGFSKAAIEEFKKKWDKDYPAQLEKMYSINGENDFVHDLGISIIPENNTHLVYTGATNIKGMHDLAQMIKNGKITIDPSLEQGAMGKFAKKLSDELMSLNDEDLQDCAITIMSMLELFMDGYDSESPVGTGDRMFANPEEIAGFISVGIPVILKTAIMTEEGRALVGRLAMESITGIANSEFGVLKLIALTNIALLCAPAVITLGIVIWGVATVFDTAYDFVSGIITGDLEASDVARLIMVATLIPGAGSVLAPLAAAVLAIVAVFELIKAIVDNWEKIVAGVKAGFDWVASKAVAFCGFVEDVTTNVTNSVKRGVKTACTAVGDVVHTVTSTAGRVFTAAKDTISDFGSRLLAEVNGFCNRVTQAVHNFFEGVNTWIKVVFGTAAYALARMGAVVATMSRIEDMHRKVTVLRGRYIDARSAIAGGKSLVNRISGYYHESYVRSCCNDIDAALTNAQRYIDAAERDLERKRRALSDAVDAYRRSERDSARAVRAVTVSVVGV